MQPNPEAFGEGGAGLECWVRRNGRWYPGIAYSWYQRDGRWRVVVRYRVAPGEQYQEARWAEDVQRERPEADVEA